MLSGAMQLRKIHYQADVWLKALHQQGQQYSFRPRSIPVVAKSLSQLFIA